jgi:hypothetical protein
LAADVAILESKIGYKVAFRSTGELISALKLYKLRKILGNKGYALLLSEIHWYMREEFGETIEDPIDLLRNRKLLPNLIIIELDRSKLSYLSSDSDFEMTMSLYSSLFWTTGNISLGTWIGTPGTPETRLY